MDNDSPDRKRADEVFDHALDLQGDAREAYLAEACGHDSNLGALVRRLLAACDSPENKLVRRTQFIMGTLVEITLSEEDTDKSQIAMNRAFDEMSRLEKLMSTHLPDSEALSNHLLTFHFCPISFSK